MLQSALQTYKIENREISFSYAIQQRIPQNAWWPGDGNARHLKTFDNRCE